MGDPYQISIPEPIAARMSAWGLPADIVHLVEEKLRNDLAADPAAHLRPCIAPWEERLNLFSFSLPDPADANRKYLFMFHVVYGDDEKTLIVVECGFQIHNARPSP